MHYRALRKRLARAIYPEDGDIIPVLTPRDLDDILGEYGALPLAELKRRFPPERQSPEPGEPPHA